MGTVKEISHPPNGLEDIFFLPYRRPPLDFCAPISLFACPLASSDSQTLRNT